MGRRGTNGRLACRLRRSNDRRSRCATRRCRRATVRQARGVAPDASTWPRSRSRPRGRSGEVGRPRAHVRHRHVRPRDHRANAPGDVRRRRRPASLGWRPGRYGDGQDPGFLVPHDDSPAHARRADRHDRADLSGGARAGPPRGPRDPGPPAWRDGIEPWRSRAARPSSLTTTLDVDGPRSPPMPSAGGTARMPSPGPASCTRDCRRHLSATRATRWTGALGACPSIRAWRRPTPKRVTGELSRTSTTFPTTSLDIERLFGLGSGRNRTDVLSDACPGRHDPATLPPERSHPDGIHPCRTGPGPRPDRLVRWTPA